MSNISDIAIALAFSSNFPSCSANCVTASRGEVLANSFNLVLNSPSAGATPSASVLICRNVLLSAVEATSTFPPCAKIAPPTAASSFAVNPKILAPCPARETNSANVSSVPPTLSATKFNPAARPLASPPVN